MKSWISALMVTALACGTALAQQQQPYAGMQNRAIKTLSDQQIADLIEGRGMGLALAAELNGYPGPMHAIKLADQLGLTSEQAEKLRTLVKSMRTETMPLGITLLEQERRLNEDFANHTVTMASLETATAKIGATQAALRAAHLKYHIATVAILTPEQIEKYNELRGYKNGEAPMQHHQTHQ